MTEFESDGRGRAAAELRRDAAAGHPQKEAELLGDTAALVPSYTCEACGHGYWTRREPVRCVRCGGMAFAARAKVNCKRLEFMAGIARILEDATALLGIWRDRQRASKHEPRFPPGIGPRVERIVKAAREAQSRLAKAEERRRREEDGKVEAAYKGADDAIKREDRDRRYAAYLRSMEGQERQPENDQGIDQADGAGTGAEAVDIRGDAPSGGI